MAPPPFNPRDWAVTVNGQHLRWAELECTLEQFHLPAQFSVTAPIDNWQIPSMLGGGAPEVVITYRHQPFFVGVADTVKGDFNGETGEKVLHVAGRDLSARLVLAKVLAINSETDTLEAILPQEMTASQMIQTFIIPRPGVFDPATLAQLQFQITPTTKKVGDFVDHDFHRTTQGLNWYSVISDLAAEEQFVFRIRNRTVYFGPDPQLRAQKFLRWQRDFLVGEYGKNYANGDVRVRVVCWGSGGKSAVFGEAGAGSLFVPIVLPPGTLSTASADANNSKLACKRIANTILLEYERGLLEFNIRDMPGDPTYDDILLDLGVSGIDPGIDQHFFPTKIHHILRQTEEDTSHVMDIACCNNATLDLATAATL